MINQLYPFSTKEGEIIPLDIIRPSGALKKAIPTGTGTTAETLGTAATPIVILRSDVNCFVCFGNIAVVPGSTIVANTVYIAAGETVVCAPGSTTYSVIGDGATGTLIVQLIEQWAGLGHETSYSAI